MLRKIALGAGAAALVAGMTAVPASAAPSDMTKPTNDGAYCVQQGIATLKALGALQAAAKGELDYAPYGSQEGGAGLINLELTSPTYFSLGAVVKLHTNSPALFDWCTR